jgi:hypothetical protein
VREGKRSSHTRLMREVNDRIFELLSGMGIEDGEFLCECSDEGCFERIQLALRAYTASQEAEDRPPFKLAGHPD